MGKKMLMVDYIKLIKENTRDPVGLILLQMMENSIIEKNYTIALKCIDRFVKLEFVKLGL